MHSVGQAIIAAGFLCSGANAATTAGRAGQLPSKKHSARWPKTPGGCQRECRDWIVFDRKNKDDYYDIWAMKADGTDQKCLTCFMCPLPEHGHKSNPELDPTGQYIVFQGQNSYQEGGNATKYLAGPGSGLNNDLWVMDAEGKRFKQLSQVPERVGGTLHPHFSPDGKQLLWTERFLPGGGASGQWSMKLAAFSVDPKTGPQNNDIQSLRAGDAETIL